MEKFLESFSWKSLLLYFEPLFYAILIFIVGHFVIKYALKLLVRFMKKSKADDLLIGLVEKMLNIVGHLTVLLSALSKLGVSTSGLLAALTAATAAIAFALKDSLSNIAGGILLIVSPRFSSGDLINVLGYEGYVTEVGLIHTTILTYDKRSVSIPNGVLINSQISNLTKEKIRRVDIHFPIPYGTNTKYAKDLAIEICSKAQYLMTDDDHQVTVRIEKYEDSSITLYIRAWAFCENYWNAYYGLVEAVLNGMSENGIDVPFNRLDVNINKD